MAIPKTSVFELTHPYRTTNDELLMVWDRVRKLDDSILELLVKGGYVARLDESIFEHSGDDEIILCLIMMVSMVSIILTVFCRIAIQMRV